MSRNNLFVSKFGFIYFIIHFHNSSSPIRFYIFILMFASFHCIASQRVVKYANLNVRTSSDQFDDLTIVQLRRWWNTFSAEMLMQRDSHFLPAFFLVCHSQMLKANRQNIMQIHVFCLVIYFSRWCFVDMNSQKKYRNHQLSPKQKRFNGKEISHK